ncbi:glycine cleavage system aminomethyltransferase GcvT [Gordonia McavH-238-E]|uniref:glycine cleavage system aminomethyltransferase GcvT n=1 Tax=Gordonia sp. McavH-238-E TaxID=2917736 RepID=UPI001EF74503|nr:glycine cleavage system aminomethyltransferase GcvT [Gordonia sp. McavH-238-E]MCG7632910.1 glycine cleavage system aminomethyltransferase GcvT [Gordonia sp. McavH-238-E]
MSSSSPSSEVLESPLLAEHEALDAHFTDFAGWRMPLKYDSDLTEHHAVRSAAGLFDLSHMGEIAVEGPDAPALLDHALVGRLSSVSVGRAKYSLMCSPEGGVIDDLVVYRLGDTRYLVVANAANSRRVLHEMNSRAAHFDSVTVTDESPATALIAVQGPASREIVQSLVPVDRSGDVTDLKYYAAGPARVAGVEVLLARTGYTGEDGFELYVPNDHAVELWRALLAKTTELSGRPAGLACRDTLRLEAGMALYGHELSEETNPFEAGLDKVVRLEKDFVGRDALAKLAEGEVRRRLVGLRGDGRRAARAGYRVLDGSGSADIGIVTSGALSPTLGHPIALAYVDIESCEPGTQVNVGIRGRHEAFIVAPSPFYRRS